MDLETLQMTEIEKQFVKEMERLEKLTPEERLKEDLEGEAVETRPIIDIGVDRWIEIQHEKEMERLKKLTPEERMKEDLKRIRALRKAEKSNWNCSK